MAGGLLILASLYFSNLKTAIIGVEGVSKLLIPTLGKLKVAIHGVGGAVSLVAANIIFYGSSRKLKKEFHALSENKEKEIREKVGLAKQKVRRSIEEQHRADNISYKVMIKRLEMEKKQREELEKKLEGK